MKQMVFFTPLFAVLLLIGAGCTGKVNVDDLPFEPPPAPVVEEVVEDFSQCTNHNDNGSVQCGEGNSWCGSTCRAEPTCPSPTTRVNCQTCTCECPDGTLGCVLGTSSNSAVPVEESESVTAGTRDIPMKAEQSLGSYYINFTQQQFEIAKAEGRPVLLYFWAGWCPICIAEEPKIKSLVEGIDVPVAGFRVNYDTESMMKREYKIPYQHTTVILNTNGVEVSRFLGPVSGTTLQAALRDAYFK